LAIPANMGEWVIIPMALATVKRYRADRLGHRETGQTDLDIQKPLIESLD
jgi:hypothetical protein